MSRPERTPSGPAPSAPADAALAEADRLLGLVGLDPPVARSIGSAGSVLPTVFRIDVAAAATVLAATAAVVALADGDAAPRRAVAVDGRAAQVSFRSERYLRIGDRPTGDLWVPLSGDYRTADGWVKIHANFAHHGRAALAALDLDPGHAERGALEAAVARAGAVEVETAVLAAGGAAGALRTAAAWTAHPQHLADVAGGVLRIEPIATAAATAAGAAPRPRPGARRGPGHPASLLSGLRVLDLTRVIAGPVCGRVLSGHGADVLAVTAAHLPQIDALVIDTGFGKRSTFLDLRRGEDRARFEDLVRSADVLVESYRPGALAALGYGPEALASLSPGLVVADVRAYGRGGPWADRRGFDSLVQMVSGIAEEGRVAAGADRPVPLPAQALDHATGWLATLGVLAALDRQRRQGGSYRVEVSLSATAAWFLGLGRQPIDPHEVEPAEVEPAEAEPAEAELADLLSRTASPFGVLEHVPLPGAIDGVAPRWATPPPRLGSSAPRWAQPR